MILAHEKRRYHSLDGREERGRGGYGRQQHPTKFPSAGGARNPSIDSVPSPANQCWPEPVPYIYKNFAMQIYQQPDRITIIYDQDHEVRHVRMNQPHLARVTPSWYGDSVGHYEGDTLVIDTVGTRTDRPFAMIDLYGTPYTEKLHVVERYRLLDYEDAKEGLERDAKENQQPPVGIDRKYRGKHLQIHFTVEDEGVFTTHGDGHHTFPKGHPRYGGRQKSTRNRFGGDLRE